MQYTHIHRNLGISAGLKNRHRWYR